MIGHFRRPIGRTLSLDINTRSDAKNNAQLREIGWQPLRIWEHELANLSAVRECIVSAFTG